MYLIDYSTDYSGRHVETSIVDTATGVIEYVSEKSSNQNFDVKRINKYEEGKLHPCSLQIKKGRIVLEATDNA